MAYKDKAQAVKVQNDWIKNTYDRINLTVPKGDKEKISVAAAAAGQSVNAYINQAIKARMDQDIAEPKKVQ